VQEAAADARRRRLLFSGEFGIQLDFIVIFLSLLDLSVRTWHLYNHPFTRKKNFDLLYYSSCGLFDDVSWSSTHAKQIVQARQDIQKN
jgi:hypothetical protein